jgi:hypothetical protein
MSLLARTVCLLATIASFCVSGIAQDTPPANAPAANPPATQPSPSDSDKDKNDKSKDDQSASGKGKVAGTSNDRLLFALPNFLTLEKGGHPPPLTSKQKFAVVAHGAFDYIQIPWYGLLSGIGQAENSEPGYGQGMAGYGKRFGASVADGTIENFMVGAILPSLLHQDPRFFQSGQGGFFRRTGYAMSRSFVTRSDSGHAQFNFSEIGGGMLAATISTNTYHPRSFTRVRYNSSGVPTYVFTPSDRTLTNTAQVWGTQLSYDTMTLVIKEFWPDIHRRMSKKKNLDAPK